MRKEILIEVTPEVNDQLERIRVQLIEDRDRLNRLQALVNDWFTRPRGRKPLRRLDAGGGPNR